MSTPIDATYAFNAPMTSKQGLVSYNMGGKMSLTNRKIDEEVESDAHCCCARVVKKIDV
jgi:hypothetical protein